MALTFIGWQIQNEDGSWDPDVETDRVNAEEAAQYLPDTSGRVRAVLAGEPILAGGSNALADHLEAMLELARKQGG